NHIRIDHRRVGGKSVQINDDLTRSGYRNEFKEVRRSFRTRRRWKHRRPCGCVVILALVRQGLLAGGDECDRCDQRQRKESHSRTLAIRMKPQAELPAAARARARTSVRRGFWEAVLMARGLCPSNTRKRAGRFLFAFGSQKSNPS